MSHAPDPVRDLVDRFEKLERKIDRLIAQTAPKRPAEDSKVFKDPGERYWQSSESYVGRQLSECPAPYLHATARYRAACAWANRKEGDPAKAKFADRDEATAKLAAAWADYREAGGTAPTATSPPPARNGGSASPPGADLFGAPSAEDDIPF